MGAAATKYEEFNPATETVQEKDGETILLYVPCFKKGQMRVRLTSTNLVRVSGEKGSEAGKSLRFRKEFPVKPNTDTNRISAKFEKGRLQLKLPKLNDQESETTADSAGNAAIMASSKMGRKLSKMALYVVLVGLVVVGVGLYFTNVEKSQS